MGWFFVLAIMLYGTAMFFFGIDIGKVTIIGWLVILAHIIPMYFYVGYWKIWRGLTRDDTTQPA